MNADMVAIAIASLGFIGTVALLIMNLTVQNGDVKAKSALEKEIYTVRLEVSNFRTEAKDDHSKAQIALERLRGDALSQQAQLYQTVIKHMTDNFVDRNVADAMHRENTTQVAAIRNELVEVKNALNSLEEKVSDIS